MYDLYVINGMGAGSRLRGSRQYRDNNNAKSLGARVSGVLFDKVELGISLHQGAWDDEGDLNLSMFGTHFLLKLGSFDLHAEYSKATSENPSGTDDGKVDGYFVQGSYLINGKIRGTVRYGNLDYLDPGFELGRSPRDAQHSYLSLGLNYYLTSNIVFKAEYDIVTEGERKSDKENNVLVYQAAVRF